MWWLSSLAFSRCGAPPELRLSVHSSHREVTSGLSRLSRGGPLRSLSLRQVPPPPLLPIDPRRLLLRAILSSRGLLVLWWLRHKLGLPRGPGALCAACGSRGSHPISLTHCCACAACGTTTGTPCSNRFGAECVAWGGGVECVGPTSGGGPVTSGDARRFSFPFGGERRVLATDGRAVRARQRRLAVFWR